MKTIENKKEMASTWIRSGEQINEITEKDRVKRHKTSI
jgi:hypothetical protein